MSSSCSCTSFSSPFCIFLTQKCVTCKFCHFTLKFVSRYWMAVLNTIMFSHGFDPTLTVIVCHIESCDSCVFLGSRSKPMTRPIAAVWVHSFWKGWLQDRDEPCYGRIAADIFQELHWLAFAVQYSVTCFSVLN